MSVRVVWMAHVVNLETEQMLEEVARLLGHQAGHDGRPLGDVYDLQRLRLGQHAGYVVYLFGTRCALAQSSSWLNGQMSQSSRMP